MMPRRTLTNCLSAMVRIEIPINLDGASVEAAHDVLRALAKHVPAGATVEVLGEPRFGRMAVAASPAPPAVIVDEGTRPAQPSAVHPITELPAAFDRREKR